MELKNYYEAEKAFEKALELSKERKEMRGITNNITHYLLETRKKVKKIIFVIICEDL